MSTPRFTLAPGLVPRVEIGVGDTRADTDPGIWDTSRWDTTARWSGVEPSWLDVSCHVIAVDSSAGRDLTVSRFAAGTATFTLANPDGWADVLADPYGPALLGVRPGRPIRWGIDDGTAVTWRWRGFIDAHAATYAGRVADADTVTLTAVDALGEVGRVRLLPGPLAGAGESPTARVGRILDAVNWRHEWRALDPSGLALLETDLGGQVVDLLGQTADTAGGSVFGDPAGRVVFRNRDWQTFLPGRVPDAVIGDGGDACPQTITVAFDRDGMTTRAVVNWVGNDGAGIVVDDPAAQLLYGIETGPTLEDLMSSNPAHLTGIANRLLASQGVDAMPRVVGVELDAAHAGAAAVMLGASPYGPAMWRVVLERAGRPVLTRDLLVTGIEDHFDASTWTTRVSLDDARPWQAAGGRWDAAYWDRSTWTDAAALLADAAALLERITA